MLILGLDVATQTGFAWYDPSAPMSTIRTGIITATGKDAEEKSSSLAQQLFAMLKSERPDFVAIEQPLRNVKTFKKQVKTLYGFKTVETINTNALQLPSLVGAAVGIVSAYRIPWMTIPAATWRSRYFGKGFKPPIKITQKEGEDPQEEKQWKKAAVDRCQQLKIPVKRHDAAEAVGVAFAAAGSDEYKMLKMRAA
ncbi:hypothetical protein [Brucella sp. BO2]|uniref:hypothetical protein n=1 Tax=Brucella sp. BO2 TaxID=693750 RepID=UPI00046CE89B|nr:hypothetical protein [Brucella sp. BO2]